MKSSPHNHSHTHYHSHSHRERSRSNSQERKQHYKHYKEKKKEKEKIKEKEKNDDNESIFSSNSENSTTNNNTNKDNQNQIKTKQIKVREIWIGNLPNGTTKSTLYKIFFIYGEISKIEINTERKFAYIRYKLVNSASNAYKKTIHRDLFNGKRVKILYSDSNIRDGIIGDENGFVLSDKTCKLIHISLNKNSIIPNENEIKEIFSKFGKIKEISARNSPGFRPSIYIEFYKYEDAKKAVDEMGKEDNLESRKKLGDPNCSVYFYFEKKIFNENKSKPMLLPMMYPPSFMLGMIKNIIPGNIPFNNSNLNNNNVNCNLNIPLNNNNNINNPLNIPLIGNNNQNNTNTQQQNNNIQNNNPLNILLMGNNPLLKNYVFPPPPYIRPTNIYKNKQILNPQFPNQQNINPINTNLNLNNITLNQNPINTNTITNTNTNEKEEKKLTTTELKEFFTDILKNVKKDKPQSVESELSSKKSEDDLDFEKEYSLEDENLKNIWSGFLTKNKKDRISVDAYQIRGDISEDFNSEYNLDVHHRTQYEEIVKRPSLGIVAFSPQNITQCQLFNEYINYFNEKQRVGVINFKSKNKFILYLVPPCEFSRKFYQNPKKHLLGILVDSNVEPKMFVDMNNLNLPPPVISSTEKKLMMMKKKKNN